MLLRQPLSPYLTPDKDGDILEGISPHKLAHRVLCTKPSEREFTTTPRGRGASVNHLPPTVESWRLPLHAGLMPQAQRE